MLEAACIAIVGLVVGALAGILNTYFMVRTAATMIGGFIIPFRFPFEMVLIVLPVVLVISLAAAWWPARKAVRMPVIEAIGYE